MIPIDLCIALDGPLVDVLLPITVETMIRHNSMEGIQWHFVEKGCSDAVVNWLRRLGDRLTLIIHHLPFISQSKATGSDIIQDVSNTCTWMTKKCGAESWLFISHFDLECKAPLLDRYRSLITDELGQIGSHETGLVGYCRQTLRKCSVGFDDLGDCFLVTDSGNGRKKVRHAKDPRCDSFDIQIHGWDVGELLELAIWRSGKQVFCENETPLQKWRTHNGSGCGRCVGANDMIRSRAMQDLARLGLEPIR